LWWEAGTNETKAATSKMDAKERSVFFMRIFLNERLFAVDFKISKIIDSKLLKVPPTNRALHYLCKKNSA
jgi:hypothetical protein